MINWKFQWALGCLLAAALPTALLALDLPAIRNGQLIVDGKPFLAIGGVLHNSSASSPDYG